MKESRFQQIAALDLTQIEAEEFFRLKKSRETRDKYQTFPFMTLYNKGAFTDQILFDQEPNFFLIDGCFFSLSCKPMSLTCALIMEDHIMHHNGIDYKFSLPNAQQAKILHNNFNKFCECLKIANELGCYINIRYIRPSLIWVRKNKSTFKGYIIEKNTFCTCVEQQNLFTSFVLTPV